MKLIYLYVNKFKMFSNKEFNLDSEYSIRYDTDSHQLKISKQHGLKANFWHIETLPPEPMVVESVSAVVGENGSGKTTFAQVLLELFRGADTRDFEYILVVKTGDKLTVHHPPELQVIVRSNPLVSDIPASRKLVSIIPNVKYCYYSPIYTTSRDRGRDIWNDGDTCCDLSTTGLLQSLVREMNVREKDVFTAFDIDEKRRVLEFLAAVADKRKNLSPPFPDIFPVAIWLEIDQLSYRQALEEMEQKLEALHSSDENTHKIVMDAEGNVLQVLQRVLNLAKNDHGSDFFIRAFMAYGILHLYDLNLTQLISVGPPQDLQLLDFLEDVSRSSDHPVETRKRILGFLETTPPSRTKNGMVIDDKLGKTVFETFQCLMSILECRKIKALPDGIGLPTNSRKVVRKVLLLSQLHAKSSIISNFLRFSFPSSISSGEMAFLSMFGRLYERFSKIDFMLGPKAGKAEAIVFLDEAETALHPSFQQQLVYNAIWFFESFFHRLRVHLIFASHSPILLSDIPKNNCVFLVRPNEEGTECIKESELNQLSNTFGANIFDLYRLSFYMETGTVGRFAAAKINGILKKLDEILPSANKRGQANLPQLSQSDRESIEEIKMLIGDEFLVRYIQESIRVSELKWPREQPSRLRRK